MSGLGLCYPKGPGVFNLWREPGVWIDYQQKDVTTTTTTFYTPGYTGDIEEIEDWIKQNNFSLDNVKRLIEIEERESKIDKILESDNDVV